MLRMIRPFVLLVAVAGLLPQTAPPDTDVFLVDVHQQASILTFGKPENITHRPGYDNQPSFLPDGKALFYTSIRNGGTTDIYRYDIVSKTDHQITNTPEGEYSATVMPGGASFSVIRVEADSTQ